MNDWYNFHQSKYRGVVVERKFQYSPQAEIAVKLVEHWGSVAGKVEGETSSGHNKVVLQTPQELVERAVETADLLIKAITEQGWIINVPKSENPSDLGD